MIGKSGDVIGVVVDEIGEKEQALYDGMGFLRYCLVDVFFSKRSMKGY